MAFSYGEFWWLIFCSHKFMLLRRVAKAFRAERGGENRVYLGIDAPKIRITCPICPKFSVDKAHHYEMATSAPNTYHISITTNPFSR